MSFKRTITILFVTAMLAINPAYTFSSECNWEMHRGSPARTGDFQSSCSLNSDRFAKYWEYDTNAKTVSSPIVYGDKIIYISDGRRLNCIKSNGSKGWSPQTLTSVDSETIPAIWNKLIFVPAWRSIDIYHLDSGRVRFSIETNYKVDSVLIVPDRGLFFTSVQDGKKSYITYQKNPLQQKKDWNIELNDELVGQPAYSSGRVYVVSGKSLYCLNYRTGVTLWKKTFNSDIYRQNVTVSGDSCFLTYDSGELICVNSSNGTQRWNVDLGKSIKTLPSIHSGSIFVGADNGSKNVLYALNTKDGKEKWSIGFRPGEELSSSPLSSSKIYLASRLKGLTDTKGIIYCVDSRNGKKVWSIEHTAGFTASPAIAGESIFISDENGKICSFGAGAKYLGFQLGQTSLTIDSTNITIDAEPVILHDRTLIPARYVIEPLGGWVRWDGSERKVTSYFAGEVVEFWIGKNKARVDGKILEIDPNPGVVPTIIDGRTMIPFRFLGESHGCKVDWIAETKEIRLTYKN